MAETENQKKEERGNRRTPILSNFWLIIGLPTGVLFIAGVPAFIDILNVSYYYLALLFSVFLGASTSLLYLVNPRYETRDVPPDYRVIHFTLRLSLAFGIGAVLVAILFLSSLLGIIT